MSSSKDKKIEGEISGVAFGGRGILRSEGKVFFIEGALPGDQVIAAVTKEKKTFGEGFAVKIDTSPSRLESPCQFSNKCGGCQWLTASIDDQVLWKNDFINSALTKFAKSDKQTSAFTRSPKPYFYRNRVSMKAACRKGRLKIGYFQRRSHDLVSIDKCHIVDEKINDVISALNQATFKLPNFDFDIDLQVLQSGKIIAQLDIPSNVKFKAKEELLTLVNGLDEIENAVVKGSDSNTHYLYDTQFGIDYFTHQGQFQQVNLEANHQLRRIVSDIVSELKPKFIVADQ